jgi:hypothetical protein
MYYLVNVDHNKWYQQQIYKISTSRILLRWIILEAEHVAILYNKY